MDSNHLTLELSTTLNKFGKKLLMSLLGKEENHHQTHQPYHLQIYHHRQTHKFTIINQPYHLQIYHHRQTHKFTIIIKLTNLPSSSNSPTIPSTNLPSSSNSQIYHHRQTHKFTIIIKLTNHTIYKFTIIVKLTTNLPSLSN